MGIEINTLKFIRSSQADFRSTLTIGRQRVFVSNRNCQRLGVGRHAGKFANKLLKEMGACFVDSLDVSGYEGASILHDLNQPSSISNRFSTIVECGTLEHVFNFPIAIHNLMRMVRIGGTLLIQTPCNNYAGHGFYQFSPELFYGVLSAANGFEIKRMVSFEHVAPYHFFKTRPVAVRNPQGTRHEFTTSNPMLLLIEAVKLRDVDAISIQQSDYATEWQRKDSPDRIPVSESVIYDLPLWIGKALNPLLKLKRLVNYDKRTS